LNNTWKIYSFLLEKKSICQVLKENNKNIVNDLLTKYNESIELVPSQDLSSFIDSSTSFVQHICGDCKSQEIFAQIIENLYFNIWENKEDVRNFIDSFNSFLNAIFCPQIFKCEQFVELILKTSSDILKRGNIKNCVVKPMMEKFIQVIAQLDSNTNEKFIDIIIELVTFGDIFKKEKRNTKDIQVFIESLGQQFATNELIQSDYLDDIEIRVQTLLYLLTTDSKLNSQFYSLLLRKSIQKDETIKDENQMRLFTNSMAHRERFRLWQLNLLILHNLNKVEIDYLIEYSETSLLTETQPSIRHIIEWVLVRIINIQISNLHQPFNFDQFWNKSKQFSHKKVGYVCSWLSVLTNLAPLIPSNEMKINYLKNLTSLILSQVLSSNFHIRVHVEAILIKLYSLFTKPLNEMSTGLNDPNFLKDSQVESLVNQIVSIIKPVIDDKERHSNLCLNHFYFNFDPIEDYCIEVILYTFPYLCSFINDELVPIESFLAILDKKKKSHSSSHLNDQDSPLFINQSLKLKSQNLRLNNCKPGIWKFTVLKEDQSEDKAEMCIEDLQKKMIPWHSLLPNDDDNDENVTDKSKKVNSELILVASLIDKGTNLGGISRTCEIFGVKELVLSNIKCIEDKLFQHLSVTSEKWLPIKEVTLYLYKDLTFHLILI
jgi:tRNA guanosine-2'-O-methyltransferase